MSLIVPPLMPLFAQADGVVPGDLIWGAPQWLVPAIVVGVVLALLVLWNYSQRGILVPTRVFAALLKLAAIGLIALCLLEPMRSGTRPRPKANVIPILIDNSQSMQLKSVSSDQSRGQRIAEIVDEQTSWRVRLAQAFDVRTYAFDARLESMDTISDLPLDGYVSSLRTSLTSLSERLAERPVGGVVLFTDGNLTDVPDADFEWSSLGFPVYPVLPRREDAVRDLRIADISTRQTDFESAPMTLRVKVDGVAMGRTKAIVQLIDETTGNSIQEKSVTIGVTDEPQEVKFSFRPEESGVRFYRVVTFTEDDREYLESKIEDRVANPDTEEATLANNERLVTVNRASGPYRILYVAGRPNWEFKFLRRALQEDAEIQLVGLLRVARKEAKFSFRDKAVTSSNPLFQGLSEDEEDIAQQYDQPVLIRLGVKESEELSQGFPESPEELFAYHGVILDDIESGFFTQDQLLMLRRFVAARGGGLLMLGGQESFASKDFGDSPLGELSPVYAPRQEQTGGPGAYRMTLTREGMLQPWVRLRENESSERERLKKMPAFTSLNAVGDLKPGASQLATVQNSDGTTSPALLAQRFGKGRSAAIPIGDMWRWSMRRDDQDRDDPAQAWRQLTHWMVNEVPRRTEVRIEKSKDPSEPVTILATARDEGYLPLDNATVQLTINPLNGDPFTIKAEADDTTPGQYKATYWSREPGGYQVTAVVTGADGSEVGQASTGWTAQSNAAEFNDLQVNRRLMERIARESGGDVINDDALDAFVADLPNRKVPVTETWIYPIWHRPWVMFLAMLCLCAEWGLRRMKGLA